MPGAEGIECALLPARVSAQAAVFAVGVKLVPPAGKDFVRVGLMAHIPDQLIVRGVEDVVQGHGQFHGAQVGAKMARVVRYHINNELP